MTELTQKQRAFVEHYLSCWSGAKAARHAGYSERTANRQASRLLSNVHILAEIEERIAALGGTANEVVLRLWDIARTDITPYLVQDERGRWTVDLAAIKRDGKGHLVKRVTTTKAGRVTVELHDAMTALALLCKHFGLLAEKQVYSGDVVLRVVYEETGRAGAYDDYWAEVDRQKRIGQHDPSLLKNPQPSNIMVQDTEAGIQRLRKETDDLQQLNDRLRAMRNPPTDEG